jgi:bacillithiol biosynthesis cysteine-adding enzyme BshC
VYSECLPFTAIPHSARLFTDFLYHFDRVRNFFPEPPRSPDWILKQGPAITTQQASKVANILVRQNRSFGASEQAIENAQRLGQGSRAVVTGQQVGLFGGPAYAIFKALTAIKYAQEFTRAGVDCVPVFWMATEDHDFAEINHVLLPGASGIQKVEISSRGPEGAPVGDIPLGQHVNEVLRAAADAFGESDFMRRLREAYSPDATFGSAFARFMASAFAPYGLVLMDPADPELHSLSAPIYSAVIERSADLNRAVLDRDKELETAGYHQQVKVTSGTSFLFALENGIRTPVQRSTSGFHISGETVSSEALLEVVRNQPHRLSPNALLRACIQDYLLPTALYIGGPAEVAYWAQSAPLQQQLLGRATPIAHRFSATLVEPPQARLLKKYAMVVTDLFAGPEHTRERLAVRVLPAQVQAHFSQSREAITQQLAALQTNLEKLDRTLVDAAKRAGSKMLYQLERLRSRAARAELRRNDEVSRHADRLSLALYPDKDLQERIYPGALYLARYGPDLLASLLEQIHIECPDHQLVYL